MILMFKLPLAQVIGQSRESVPERPDRIMTRTETRTKGERRHSSSSAPDHITTVIALMSDPMAKKIVAEVTAS